MAISAPARYTDLRRRVDALRERLERLLLWRIWERMLEIEFVDRSVALAGNAFISFFPLVIVVAAFVPERMRSSIITTVAGRLGIHGDAFTEVQHAFASSDDVRRATGVVGLVFTIFYATSFTTALQRVYLRAWRRPPGAKLGGYWRGATWLLAMMASLAVLGFIRGALDGAIGVGLFIILSLSVTTSLWWFSSWFFLLGEVRPRVLLPAALITSVPLGLFAISATLWMPSVVKTNENQFGFFGIALALVTWFSGAAICVLIGACAGPVLADDTGRVGTFIRGSEGSSLKPGAKPPLPPPTVEPTLRDAFLAPEHE
jgi:membrane protein